MLGTIYQTTVVGLRAIEDRTERLGEEQFAYLIIAPPFVILALIAFWPLLRTFQLSLHADNLIGSDPVAELVVFKNYVDLLLGKRTALLPRPFVDFQQPFKSALIVTIVFAVISVLAETLLGLVQALLLDKSFRARGLFRLIYLLPWTVPIVIHGMIWYLMFQSSFGFGADLMASIGFPQPLSNSTSAFVIVTIGDIWKTTPFMALLILAGLQSIDRELYQVAKISGASRWQQFVTITLPLALPAILVAMLFRTLQAMRIFGAIETIAGCGTVPSLSCLVVLTFNSGRYGTSAAIAFITAGIIGVMALVYIYYYAKGEGM
jgi:multiple sugar transport system permease protein